MASRSDLKQRVQGIFALVALSVPVLLGSGLWAAAERLGDGAVAPLVLFGGGAGCAILGVVAWAWLKLDAGVVAPLFALTRNLETLVHANPGHEVAHRDHGYLDELASATRRTGAALKAARNEVARAIADATTAIDEQKGRLEVILRDLHEGVLICNLDHQMLLYNQRALEILHVSGDLGLGRSLFSIMNRQPFLHALERLTARFNEGRHHTHQQGLSVLVVCSTTDGRHILEGRVSLILDADEEAATGYVVTFDDITGELATLAKRDSLLREAVDGLRRPVANLRAAFETLTSHPDLDAEGRALFEGVLAHESEALSRHLERLGHEYHDIVTGHWPMSDVYSANLLNCVVRRFREERQVEAVMTGIPVWLHCDSHTIVELLDHLIHRISQRLPATSFDLEASRGERRVYIDIRWHGEVIPSGLLDSWLDDSPDQRLSGLTARDVLEHHDSELWCEAGPNGTARLRLPLPLPVQPIRPVSADKRRVLPRPEFYDFDLLKRIDASAAAVSIGDRPLRSLTYVVFDCETTGLEPSRGDEIISIAGMRIVNGRILTGEAFSEMVNPRRAIPQQTVRVHGITEDMVRDRPGIEVILPKFHKYVGDAVLVAHNAAFDMKFLELKQRDCGVAFNNPVLDTVLLSAHLYGQSEQHTLDAVAERFGIEIEGRHTALGDSIVTAGVLLRIIDLLEAQNICTLAEALEASNRIVEIRRQQARY